MKTRRHYHAISRGRLYNKLCARHLDLCYIYCFYKYIDIKIIEITQLNDKSILFLNISRANIYYFNTRIDIN